MITRTGSRATSPMLKTSSRSLLAPFKFLDSFHGEGGRACLLASCATRTNLAQKKQGRGTERGHLTKKPCWQKRLRAGDLESTGTSVDQVLTSRTRAAHQWGA